MSESLLDRVEKCMKLAQTSGDSSIQEMGYIIGLLSEKCGIASTHINDNMSIISYVKGDYIRSFDSSVEAMKDTSWSETECSRLRFNQHFSIDKISHRYSTYDPDNVGRMTGILLRNRKKYDKKVTVTMTSCKRYDLFYQTVSSFLNCCLDIDLIDEWIVVDDGSSEEDRTKMITDFPFIKYIWKSIDDKGHPRSMNIIKSRVDTPYIFHMEDDWLFFRKENYISTCISILETDNSYGQCLLNRVYGERARCHDLVGGVQKFCGDKRYYEHQFLTGSQLDNFNKNNKGCAYWPHYSLRVGMTRTSALQKIGEYNERASHFEMEYAYRYLNAGFKTTYMDNIYCLHIGRCTFERDTGKLNAYDLNNEVQFGEVKEDKKDKKDKKEVVLTLSEEEQKVPMYYTLDTEIKEYDITYRMKTYVVNLKSRPDRLKQFIVDNHESLHQLQYEVFEAIDGKEIMPTPKNLKLFETGDYKYRKGIMGCASSHIKIWHELIVSPELDIMLVLEDDITLAKNFIDKLIISLRRLPPNQWDMVFLGHFLYPNLRKDMDRSDVNPTVERWDKNRCISQSMGGTIGYVISKKGAIKMYKHIHENGVYNAIDWVMFKTADVNSIYYCYPHIVFSECVTQDKKPDSDIQYDVTSLCPDDSIRLKLEMEYWIGHTKTTGVCASKVFDWVENNPLSKVLYTDTLPCRDTLLSKVCFIETSNYMDIIRKMERLPVRCYTLNGRYVVVIPTSKIDDKIVQDVVLDGGYLNIDCPV